MRSSRRRVSLPLILGSVGVWVVATLVVSLAPRVSWPIVTATQARPEADPQTRAPSAIGSSEQMDTVVLTREKAAVAGLTLEPAREMDLTESITVSGTIEPDPNLQFEVRPRVAGVVRQVEVEIGQKVERGELLAVVDSIEIATARLDLMAQSRELVVARAELDWESAVTANVEALTTALQEGVTGQVLETRFAGKPLGDDRAMLLAAYADLEAATVEENRQRSLSDDRVVGAPAADLASRARQASRAKYDAALEQVVYDARLKKRRNEQAVKSAEAAVSTARQRLRIFGLAPDEIDAVSQLDPADTIEPEALTEYRIHAPFAGTIVDRWVLPSQHVEPADKMLLLVDMLEVHVDAYVPESQFGFLPLIDSSLRFTAAAYPGRVFEARVHSTGARIDDETRAVPVHAHVMNPDGSLRLGMFVEIQLTHRESAPGLTVPASAVVEIEGEPAVFRPGSQPRSYVRQRVQIGERTGDRVVILQGLKAGQQVVAQGAFLLKSELILKNEPAED